MKRIEAKQITILLIILTMIGCFSVYFTKATSLTYGRPWDTPQKALTGGAQYIGASYISRGQYTSYFKRFNVAPDRQYSAYSHQYMTNIRAPYSEAYTTYKAYKGNLSQVFHFYIPIYNNMPSSTSLPKNSTTSVSSSKKSTKKGDSAFESQISQFPDTYKPYLRYLHQIYPKWVFQPVKTDLKWSSAVTAEQKSAYIDGSDKTLRAVDKNGKYILKEGKSWYLANETTTAFFMDPRNFLNEYRIFMFESLRFENTVSLSAIQTALNGSCLSGSKNGVSFKQMFYNAGKAANINPVYLASLATQEQGTKGNVAITGDVIYYDGKLYKDIYNYFNIGAYSSSSSPAKAGVAFAAGYISNTKGKITKVNLSTSSYTYNGSTFKPSVTVYFDDYKLSSSYYSVQYTNNINAGSATVKVTGKSPFSGTISKTFKINPCSISSFTFSSIKDQKYTGSSIKPSVTIKNGSKTLKNGTDYTLTYGTNKAVGKGTVKVIGKGNYIGEKTLEFNIVGNTIDNCTINDLDKVYYYTGKAIKPVPTIKLANVTLKEGTDYTLAYSNNVNIGTAMITIKGKGSYSGSIKVTFKIEKGDLKNSVVSKISNQSYTGKAIKPTPTVKFNGITLKNGTDYTLSYSNNTKVGTATITINGKGAYSGSKKVTFKIEKGDLKNSIVSKISNQSYTGKAIKPTPTVELNGKTLKNKTDYTLTYSNNTKVGTATITIKGQGTYIGSKKVTFKIVKAKIKDCTISSIATQYYTGKQIKPSVTVKWNGKTLKKGTDYTLTYGTNKNVGKGTIKITGKGVYEGSITKSFTIAKKTSKFTVSSLSNRSYTGKAIKPNVVVKSGSKTLKKNTDYTISYGKNINPGKATVTVKGKGKYSGTVTKTFIILPKQVSWNSLKGVKNTLQLSYKKVPGASGYRIEYSKKEKSGYKYLTTKSLKPKITKLSYKTKYYVRVRAYITVNGKKYYGNESWTLEVRTK